MTDPRKRAVIQVGLSTGADDPALDAQLLEGLRNADEQGLEVGGVAGAVGGALNVARQGQVTRLFEQLRARELPAAVAFLGAGPADPADLTFLGHQARTHGFSIAVRHDRITVVTPWKTAAGGGLPG